MVVVVTGAVVGPSTYDENDKNVVIKDQCVLQKCGCISIIYIIGHHHLKM